MVSLHLLLFRCSHLLEFYVLVVTFFGLQIDRFLSLERLEAESGSKKSNRVLTLLINNGGEEDRRDQEII